MKIMIMILGGQSPCGLIG